MMAKKPAKVSVSGNCHIDSSSTDLRFPCLYRPHNEWVQYDDLQSFCDAIENLAMRAGFKDRAELENYVKTVFYTPPRKKKDYAKKRHSAALDEGFI